MKRASYFLAAAFCMFVASGAAHAQSEDDVVVGEFAVNPTTGKEYVELLVTKPGGINMQSWTISDVSTRAGATAATEGDVTLPAASYLSSVPQGTYIVIVFTTPAANTNTLTEDTSLADGNGKLVLIAGSTTGVTTAGTIDNATNDNLHLYAGTRAAGTLIDQVLAGTNTSFIAGATWGDNNGATTTDNINAGVAIPGNAIARFVPTLNTLAGFQDNDTGARFVVDASSYGTPGGTNTGVTDSAVTNPSYASGNVDAGSFNGLTTTGDVGLAGNVTVHGTMTIGGLVTTGANTLTIDCGGSISGASPAVYVIGNLKKTYCSTGVKGFEVGTANGYSPVSATVTAGTFPADFTVKAVQGPQPSFVSPQYALQRYWPVIAAPNLTLDLTLNYLATDVPVTANEAAFVIFACDGGVCDNLGGTVNTINHSVTTTGQTTDQGGPADLTAAQANAPTAADGRISGITVDGNGAPISGAVIYLNGTQNRKTITDANGNYRFDNVETNGFYTVTPLRVNYSFSPGNRSFSQLGNNTDATFTGSSDGNNRNPLDTPEYFVRQHYLDFLGREPDESGFNFWSDQILECRNDAACIERRTVNVSAAYFLSVEFQQTGGLVDRLYKASFGRSPRYAEFVPDTAAIARGVVVGRSGWQQLLAANEESFVDRWVERAAFHAAFDSLSHDSYVDTLLSNTGVSFTQTERDSLVSGLGAGTLSRGQVLEQIANSENFGKARFNEAFVMMEYFGYLRRDPDASGYAFWLNKLNEFNGNFERAEMVKAFIDSGEYRARFVR